MPIACRSRAASRPAIFPAARVAPKGSTWGRGRHPVPSDGTSRKAEGDDRTPAGVFEFGSAFGYDATWVTKTKIPFVTVGVRDLFVEDPQSPSYNQHVRLDHERVKYWMAVCRLSSVYRLLQMRADTCTHY